MVQLKILVTVVSVFALAGSFPLETEVEEFRIAEVATATSYRLPNNTRPIRYDISFTTHVHNAGQRDFTGVVRIRIEVLETSNSITIHQRHLTIARVDLFSGATPPVPVQENIPFTENPAREFVIIPTVAPMQAGQQFVLQVTYSGLLRDFDQGLYRSSYMNSLNQTVWLASTQFESTNARHGFPCYDEPQLRAIFGVQITHHSSYHANSNWPIASRTPVTNPANYVTTSFQDTFSMPTYIVAFMVSDYDYISDNSSVLQRVFAKPESVVNREVDFALHETVKFMDIAVDLFGVPYYAPKLDQAAVPDFIFGAMENWGLFMYREEFLLDDPALTTTRQQDFVREIIAHELAHNWFGNHVTIKWFTYIWVKEGFAILYEQYLVHLAYPQNRLMDTFVTDIVHSTLNADAGGGVRAMTSYVESPAEILASYDFVNYGKAGSVLAMIQYAFGVDTFTRGLQRFLIDNAYGAAAPEDLYAALQPAIDEDLGAFAPDISVILDSWTLQAGFPLVTVLRNNNQLTFVQERFFLTNQTSNNLWWIPINYVVGSNPNFTETRPDFWMQGQPVVTITNNVNAPKAWTANDWIVVNIQERGYYRVNYDKELWGLLIRQLHSSNFTHIHAINRAQIIDDSLNLARAGRITYETPFEILRYMTREVDYIPWAATNRAMTFFFRWLENTPVFEYFQEFVANIITPLYNRQGFAVVANEHRFERFSRQVAINLACQAGIPDCINSTESMVQAVVNGGSIHPDLQATVYCSGLRQANPATFNFFLNKMLASNFQGERTTIITALGCNQNYQTLLQFLQMAIQPNTPFRLVEIIRVLVSPANGGEPGLRAMMDFIEANYNTLMAFKPSQLNGMLGQIAVRITTQDIFNSYVRLLFILVENNALSASGANNFRASANGNFAWQANFLEPLGKWLREGNEGVTEDVTDTTGVTTEPTTTTGAGSVFVSTIALIACAFVKYFV